jgi:hypothetical protein
LAATTGKKFSKLTWLKRTNGHKFTPSEFRVLISLFNHSSETGKKSHPGIELMMEETGLSKGVVSAAVTGLKQRGWIHETYRGSGYSKKASAFELIPDAPNPAYACPPEQARSCFTCLHSSEYSEPCTDSRSYEYSELCDSHSSDSQVHSSDFGPSIVTATRNPSDPGSDPKIRSYKEEGPIDPPSDQPRSQQATKASESLPVRGKKTEATEKWPMVDDDTSSPVKEATKKVAELFDRNDPWATNPLDQWTSEPVVSSFTEESTEETQGSPAGDDPSSPWNTVPVFS